jgi:hypothetical protein
MAAPVIIPELQFIDADGHPYAGGTLETYVVGTSTPKQTWVDPDQTALQTNPIVLDAAGRCLCWGDGNYRLILRDSAGNQVWDQPATTIVSAAMAPVVAAPTIADALELLGIQDLIDAEAAARSAADSAEQTARIAADSAEQTARIAADNTLTTNLNAEIARATAAEAALAGGALSGGSGYAHLPGGNLVQWGAAGTTGGGTATVYFPIPFPTACQSVQVTLLANSLNLTARVSAAAATNAFAVFTEDTSNTGGKDSFFYWSAFGN